MKQNKKIDFYDAKTAAYLCSTIQSKTLKEAIKRLRTSFLAGEIESFKKLPKKIIAKFATT